MSNNQTPECFRGYSKIVRPKPLPDRAFHFELDQTFELDAVFHGELAHESVDEPVHAQAHRLRLAQTALLHVENLLRADLADAGFVLHGVTSSAHGDRRISIRTCRRVDEQRVALGIVLAIL